MFPLHLTIKLTLPISLVLLSMLTTAQVRGIAINDDGTTADTSAILDLNINTALIKKGLLIPRVTTTQRNAIPLPATGLLVFNTTTNWFEYNIGSTSSPSWIPLLSSLTGWKTNGNSGTSAGTNFIGTTDNAGFLFKINNTNAGFIDNSTNSNNLYFGLNAGHYGVSTGSNNLAVGALSLLANTSGSNNAAFGYSALSTNTTGSNNVAMGYNANNTLNTASNTTLIGYNATSNNSNSVAIGSTAQANNLQATSIGNAAAANGNNSTAIGNGASTSQNNAFILGNSSVNVGIATSTPNTSAKLDVNGSFKLGTNGSVLTSIIKTTGSLTSNVTFPLLNLAAVAGTITVPGASVNSNVIINPRSALPTGVCIAYAYVSSANTITVYFQSVLVGASTILTSLVFDISLLQ
jgi:hypothetical protein